MVHIGTDAASAMRLAREREYGQWVATEEIYIDGVLTFGIGFPVPISHVEKFPELLEEEAVARVEMQAPAANAKREAWVDYARGHGAPEAELVPVADGGLSRKSLVDQYGEQAAEPKDAESN